MSIDNRLTPERIKKALNMRTVLIILIIVAFLTTIFYITLENRNKNEILIWHITADSEDLISPEALKLCREYATEAGYDKLVFTKRNPEDQYFDAAMSTSALYNCDIFIMSEEMAAKYAEIDMFMPLTPHSAKEEDLLYLGGEAVGISVDGNYYLLVNSRASLDEQTIYDIIDILLSD